MTRTVVVRYRVRPDAVEENVSLVKAVYDELSKVRPEGLRYSTYRVDDFTFVHVAVVDGEGNPLEQIEAFRRFSSTVSQRCQEGPIALAGEVIGSYFPG